MLLFGAAADDDRSGQLVFEVGAENQSVEARRHEIDQNEVRGQRLKHRLGFGGTLREAYQVAEIGESISEELSKRRVILDHNNGALSNLGRCHPPPLAIRKGSC